jgi:hypothetical protein
MLVIGGRFEGSQRCAARWRDVTGSGSAISMPRFERFAEKAGQPIDANEAPSTAGRLTANLCGVAMGVFEWA